MNNIHIADRMELVHSDIRGPLFVEALEMQARGIDILKLNTGNPAAFGFPLPESIRSAIEGHTHEALGYCDFKGMPAARQAICDYESSKGIQGLTPDDIFIGNGVSEVVTFALLPLLNPGDEVLIPMPSYSLWGNSVRIGSGTPVFYRCDEASEWNPDMKDVEAKINSHTRAIVIINPNNPTGALYPREILEGFVKLAREHNLLIFADEIYDQLVMGDVKHISIASLAPDLPVVTMNGLSKSHSLCGYRCGWMAISGPRELTADYRNGIVKLTSMRLCSNALAQLVIPAALSDRVTPKAMVSPGGRIYEQSRATVEEIEKIDGLTVVPNKAAFYVFPKLDIKKFGITDDRKFARDLLRGTNILIVPGSGFDWPDPDHFRIVMLPEADKLRDALRRIGTFLDGYHA